MASNSAYKEDDYLQLSGIQHFAFCRRQWALIHVEQQWIDNILTAKGVLDHKRVHNDSIRDVRNGIVTIRGMKVSSKELGVSGECDAVEFIPSEDGISLFGRDGYWQIRPVEYKHGVTKEGDFDRLQTALQVLCLEEMFSCHIKFASIFYFSSRRREQIEITEELRDTVKTMVYEMHSYYQRGYTPKVKPGKRCKSCSLEDMCMPLLMQKNESVAEYIDRHIKGEANEENA